MQINREYEQEIELKDLIFHILYRWRSCIIAALIGAVLLGGFRYVKNLRRISAQQAAPAVTAAESAQEEEDADYMLENYRQTAASYSRILEGYMLQGFGGSDADGDLQDRFQLDGVDTPDPPQLGQLLQRREQ